MLLHGPCPVPMDPSVLGEPGSQRWAGGETLRRCPQGPQPPHPAPQEELPPCAAVESPGEGCPCFSGRLENASGGELRVTASPRHLQTIDLDVIGPQMFQGGFAALVGLFSSAHLLR